MNILDPLPIIYSPDKDVFTQIPPNPLEEHQIYVDESVYTGMEMDSIQHHILPKWGKSPGASALTKTQVARTDVLTQLQTKYDFYSNLPDMKVHASDCGDFRADLHTFYKDTAFYKKFNFMNWKMAEPFNQSADFMGINTLSQYVTPVMHAVGPVYVMLIPLMIVIFDLVCGTDSATCSSKYICHVYRLLNKHFIGKRIFQLQMPFWGTALLLGLWAAYYVFQGYMHYSHVRAFTKNMVAASDWIDKMKHWINHALYEWDIGWNSDLVFRTLSPVFYLKMDSTASIWRNIQSQLDPIPSKEMASVYDVPKIGSSLVKLYRIFTSEECMKALFEIPLWTEYVGALRECAHCMKRNFLTKAVYISDSPGTEKESPGTEKESPASTFPVFMNNHIHPSLDRTAVSNTTSLDNSVILTGLNASGKSTCMRSVLANILLSQSIGLGRYSECHLLPYTHFHLYVNIPDALEKDSLFEAEVRRCKDILDSFDKGGHHFCAFDELFTGTNSNDAENITYSYLHFISTHFSHVQFWLTTHFHEACRRLQTDTSRISFYEMKGYTMTDGISSAVNAVSILQQFQFPTEIITNTLSSLSV